MVVSTNVDARAPKARRRPAAQEGWRAVASCAAGSGFSARPPPCGLPGDVLDGFFPIFRISARAAENVFDCVENVAVGHGTAERCQYPESTAKSSTARPSDKWFFFFPIA
ncbi:hypothetical protein [Achromobacter denitrificans]|uniref:hypothetical protein n=1 Tax=Achromobacter denitrificans TaxID=32002 RepID=UPI001055E0E8|nr:hypothetical protein [Achromobacter denitrificans]QKH45344.1 hypothetical protein FOC82_29240 [Achromobacter denitrificans]QKH53314.1 hypothetical protein FOC80_29230 [Achromobacter denitrificans]